MVIAMKVLPLIATITAALLVSLAAHAQTGYKLIAPDLQIAAATPQSHPQQPPGLPQNGQRNVPETTHTMSISPVPYDGWDIRYREHPDGRYEYEWASAATVLRKLGVQLNPRIDRIDLYGADGGGFAKLRIRTSWLSGRSNARLPD